MSSQDTTPSDQEQIDQILRDTDQPATLALFALGLKVLARTNPEPVTFELGDCPVCQYTRKVQEEVRRKLKLEKSA